MNEGGIQYIKKTLLITRTAAMLALLIALQAAGRVGRQISRAISAGRSAALPRASDSRKADSDLPRAPMQKPFGG